MEHELAMSPRKRPLALLSWIYLWSATDMASALKGTKSRHRTASFSCLSACPAPPNKAILFAGRFVAPISMLCNSHAGTRFKC